MDKNLDFARNVIKGKIAELIFEFMFRESGKYTIIPFGYEYTQPELAQHIDLLEQKDILETLRNTPDFIITSLDRKNVYFVEVKYRKTIQPLEIKEACQKLVQKWQHAYLFLASPEGFFYEPCQTIIEHDGMIGKLYETHVSQETQTNYLRLLNEFEK
jgi:hypothetical protein